MALDDPRDKDAARESPDRDEEALEELLSRYVDRLNAGEMLDAEKILAEHPDDGPELVERLEAFQAVCPSPRHASALGTLGDYTLRRQIGRGGMGVVYDAWQNSLDRQVALKVLPAGIAADSRAFMRFMREAKTAAQLQHQNVVAVYGMGVEANTPYYAMEFVDGETLAHVVAKLKSAEPESPTPFGRKDGAGYFEELAHAFADAADGLQHAHAKGVIHRDIKPSNLILDRERRLRILDFGLARQEGQESLTASGDVIGTVNYMSPEQAQVKKIAVDHRTDIYSLGATLYEVLALRPPFKGKDHHDTLTQIIAREPTPLRTLNARVPRDLETIVLKCLRKEPADRYGTAEALGQDLRRFARGDAIEARPVTQLERTVHWVRRRRRLLCTAGLFAFLLGAVVWLAIRRAEGERLIDTMRKATIESRYRQAVMNAAIHLEESLGSRGTILFPGVGFVELAPAQTVMAHDTSTDDRVGLKTVIADLEEARKLLPGKADARYHMARAFLAYGDRARALTSLDALLADTPDFAPAVVLRLVLPAMHSTERQAISTVAGVQREVSPTVQDWKTLMLSAQEALGKREWEKAGEAYEVLVRQLDTMPEPYVGASLEFWLGRGKAHLAARKWNAAIADFAGAAALWPRASAPRFLLANTYYFKGERAEAERVLQDIWASSADPDEVAAGASSFFLELDDPKRATPWIERLAEDDRGNLLRAKSLSAEGNTARAIEICDTLLTKNPQSSEALKVKMRVLVDVQCYDRVAEIARAALSIWPDDGEFWSLLGWAEFYACRLSTSVEAFERSITVIGRPDDRTSLSARARSYSLNGLGWAVRRIGDLARAKEAYELALLDNPDNGAAWLGLGSLARESGDVSEFVRCHAESLVRCPLLTEAFHFLLIGYNADTAACYRPYWRPVGQAARDALDRGRKDSQLHALLALQYLNDPESLAPAAALIEAKEAAQVGRDPLLQGIVAQALVATGDRAAAILILEGLVDAASATRFHVQLLDECRRGLLPRMASVASVDWLVGRASRSSEPASNDPGTGPEGTSDSESREVREYAQGCLRQSKGAFEDAARIFGSIGTSGVLKGADLGRLTVRRTACLVAMAKPDVAERELRDLLASRNDLSDVRFLWQEWLRLQWTVLDRDCRAILDAFPTVEGGGYAADVRWLLEELSAGHALRINCGGEAYADRQNRQWGKDRFFRGGEVDFVSRPQIAGTEDATLYWSRRNFSPEADGAGYEIPLPPGTYRVRLHFCEIYYDDSRNADGIPRRKFEVYVQGMRVDGYDPVKFGYCAAHTKAAGVEVSNGLLEVTVVARRLKAPLCALEVEKVP